jgi:hypothetical protein
MTDEERIERLETRVEELAQIVADLRSQARESRDVSISSRQVPEVLISRDVTARRLQRLDRRNRYRSR